MKASVLHPPACCLPNSTPDRRSLWRRKSLSDRYFTVYAQRHHRRGLVPHDEEAGPVVKIEPDDSDGCSSMTSLQSGRVAKRNVICW